MIHKRKLKRIKPSNLQSMVFWGKTNTKQSTRQHERALCEKKLHVGYLENVLLQAWLGCEQFVEGMRGCCVNGWGQ